MEGLVESLKRLGSDAARLARRLAAYEKLLANPVNNANLRERELADIRRLAAGLGQAELAARLGEWLAGEQAEVDKARTEFRFEFGRQLVAGLEGSGMSVRGQLPVLRVGLYTLRVDFDAGSATAYWGPEIEKLRSGMRLEPAELARTLWKWDESLKAKATAPERLLRSLRAAYRRNLAVHGLAEGTRVFLLDLLGELVLLLQPESFRLNPSQEKFVEYPRVRFSYDLYRLRQSGSFAVGHAHMKLHVANFDATTEKAKALWVPDNESGEGTHYSYVSFSDEGPGAQGV